jgi:hypothetical protein
MNFKKILLSVLGAGLMSAWAGPVSYHGQLKAVGSHLKNSDSTRNVQIKGPSLYWSTIAGAPQYSKKTVDWFVENMDISVIRAAMAIKYWDNYGQDPIYDGMGNLGYLSSEDDMAKTVQLARIEDVIKAAILNDIYVIVDWHSHQAHKETADAKAFFVDIATRYQGVPNLIFEIYNEPTSSVTLTQVSSYANEVIAAIRATGNENLILVGSPYWSSDPNGIAVSSNLHTAYKNIAYTVHFYASTHFSTGDQRSSANKAMKDAGVTVFASEWGTTEANGTGTYIDAASVTNWTTWFDSAEVSSCNWSAVNLSETSAMWDVNKENNIANLSASGQLFYAYMQKKIAPPTGYPSGLSKTLSLLEGQSQDFTLTDVSATTGATFVKVEGPETGMGTVAVTPNKLTYTVPAWATQSTATFVYVLDLNGKQSKHRITVNINRKPSAGTKNFSASKVKPTTVNFTTLAIADPENNPVTIVSVVPVDGSAMVAADGKSFVYTPPLDFVPVGQTSKTTSVLLTISDGTSSVQETLTATIQNLAPEIGNEVASIPNTAPFSWQRSFFAIYDGDQDTVLFAAARVESGYPGTVVVNADKKSVTYTPDPNKISGARVPIYITVTDGELTSKEGRLMLSITGTGSAIVQDQTAILSAPGTSGPDLRWLGAGYAGLELDQSGDVRLDVYSLQGRHMGSLLSGYQGSGSYRLSLDGLDLRKGAYFMLLRQGATLRSLRFVQP